MQLFQNYITDNLEKKSQKTAKKQGFEENRQI